MPALDQQLGHLHQGIARLAKLGMRLDEAFELVARLFQEVLAEDQVARLGGLVDQRAAFLVVEDRLDGLRLGAGRRGAD